MALGLVAILLVTRTRPGPKLVFCYPPNPQRYRSHGNVNENGGESEDDSDSDGDHAMPTPLRQIVSYESEWMNGKATTSSKDEIQSLDPGHILGFSEDSLEKLLSPGCWSDRQKFEVSLDGLTFVGHPIYAAQDGSWKHKHTHEITPTKNNLGASKTAPAKIENTEQEDRPGITITEPKTPSKGGHDFTHVPESFESRGLSLGTSMNSVSTTSVAVPEQLTSFNLILVLDPNKAEDPNTQISQFYNHIVKKLSKALHYCQKHSAYVGLESRKFMTLKAKAKLDNISRIALCKQMVDTCELAWALKEVYEKISVGAVADIRLEEKEMSLFIPKKSSEEAVELTIHCGLLLLENRNVLLQELNHPDAAALAHFVRQHTPTKSLQKLAVRLGMSIEHVLSLARYLIAWQKAKAISPLHRYNTYVLSPHAPLHLLDHYIELYARTFPVLHPLTEVLKYFNRTPLKYGMLPPTRDHREPYMGVLAWLVRYGFFEQLKTSAWLRAPTTAVKPAIKVAENKNTRPLSVASLLSPQLRPVDDDAASVSSERTAIPVSKADPLKKHAVTNGANHSRNGSDRPQDPFGIITDPLSTSPENKLRLQHIQDSITDSELADHLPSLLRYFDGEATLEEIGPREGLKRSKVDAWLQMLQEMGFLLTFCHL